MHVYVCLHTHECVCVLGPCPGEEKVKDSGSPPPRLLFHPQCPAHDPAHPPQDGQQKRASPSRRGLTGSAALRLTLIAPESPRSIASPWSTSATRSAGDPDHSALAQESAGIRKERPWAASSGLPCPLRRGQKTGQRTKEGRVSQAEGVWRKRGGAQLCCEDLRFSLGAGQRSPMSEWFW